MSFNIRYGTAKDGANAWHRRAHLVLDRIRSARPALLGLQECQELQQAQLRARLPAYAWLGEPRDPGAKAEACPLLVDLQRFRVEDSGTFWLSPDPEKDRGKAWDAAFPRICTWAIVRDRHHHGRLLVANTHFDHRGKRARRESARLLAAWAQKSGLPVVLMGDFNAGEKSAAMQTIRDAGLVDSWRQLHPDAAEPGTYTGFKRVSSRKIDHIFVSPEIPVRRAHIDDERSEGRWPSDHFAVHAAIQPPTGDAPKLMPSLRGEPWYIGDNPDLGGLGTDRQEIVDHAIWQAADGSWQLWACIRRCKVGRVLYGWEGGLLTQKHWRQTGVRMRARPDFGESIDDWGGQEWIQAPHVIRHAGRYHMLYGGHRSELEHCQTCLATSEDGKSFIRHRNALGQSRVFVGPGEARDPMTIAIDGVYHCYYTGNPDPYKRRDVGGIYCRTSRDLIRWSEPRRVSWGGKAGRGMWSAECPHVVYREGYYYLFRTTNYRAPLTHVYRSRDPMDFGLDEDSKYIGSIAVAAPEVVRQDGRDYISSVHDLTGGVQLYRLDWLDESEADRAEAFRQRCAPLFDFEQGGLIGWTAEGTAMQRQPSYAPDGVVRGQNLNLTGSYFIGTYEDRPGPQAPAGRSRGDGATGRLRSPAFELPEGRVTFRLGGGRDPETLYLALCLADGDKELFRATGQRSNYMRSVTWDVREHAGKQAYLLLVDANRESWGHINFDDFRVER